MIKLDPAAIRRDGIEVPAFTEVEPQFGQPGGGNEIRLDQFIDKKYLDVVAKGRK